MGVLFLCTKEVIFILLEPEKLVKVRWNPSNKEWYTNKGYEYTKYNEYFDVKIKDLSINSNVRVNVICDYCGKSYNTTYGCYYLGHSKYPKDCCSRCTGKKTSDVSRKRRADEAFSKLYEFCKIKNYILLTTIDEYTDAKMDIKYICPIHGETHGSLDNMIHGHGCVKCGRETYKKIVRNSFDKIEKYINSINNNTLLNKEEYVNAFEPNLRIRCKCGNIFTTSYSNYKHSTQSCKDCSSTQSKHEAIIQSILDDNKIEYISEKRFYDCRDKKPLPFDFYIPKYNLIIEYDGEGHYLESFHFGKGSKNPKKALDNVQHHDRIKNNYCKLHKINLLRIPYWEKNNIEEIIINELNKHIKII